MNKRAKFFQKLVPQSVQRGFTLIELMLVLGLATVIALVAVQTARRDSDYQLANAAATQMQELNVALSRQISNNSSAYSTTTRTVITLEDLKNAGLLPTVYKNQTPFGGTINMEVVATAGTTPTLTGLVTTSPWLDGNGTPRYDLLGAAVRRIGAQGGVTFYTTDTVSGLNGLWSATNGGGAPGPGQFTFINAAGQLAVRSYGDTSGYDNIYLRRDGTLPMLGNLDMGFHDINNAVNISANGWVNANHIAANDATVGSLFSNYIRNTGGIDTPQITGIGVDSASSFANVVARKELQAHTVNLVAGSPTIMNVGVDGTSGSASAKAVSTPGRGIVNVQDLYIRDVRGNAGNSTGYWLSDRLPKFASRGIYFVTNDDEIMKPDAALGSVGDSYACSSAHTRNTNPDGSGVQLPSSGGVAKIEIIPQTFFTQGKTDGLIDFGGTSLFADPSGVVYGTIQANPDLNTITNFRAYAEDLGDRWNIHLNNWAYYSTSYPFNSGWALAHVYCDFS